MNGSDSGMWTGTSRSGRRANFKWSALLWSLIYPQGRQRILPTVSGVLLIGLSLGIGLAAYNASNNILFITLSLLLACLILSGVLSWLNFRRVSWRLQVAPPLRAGQEAVVTLDVRNGKRVLPTYGLWFDVAARSLEGDGVGRAETTFTARGAEVKAALARAEQALAKEKLFLATRLDPGGAARLEWEFRPTRRGYVRVELESVGSLFPFGFLKKSIGAELREHVVVWPAPVEYRRLAVASARRAWGGERVTRAGSGSDLLALRRYVMGDSHRLIHWKASARTGRLLVRQFAAESAEAFSVWVQTGGGRWTRAEQFELLVSFAATLAEDLFRAERLANVALDNEPPIAVRQVRDLEGFLDRLAVVTMESETKRSARVSREDGAGMARRRNLVTFSEDGPRGVAAYVEGQKMAAA
jgi:uncharacterized protein (DUF58 family)